MSESKISVPEVYRNVVGGCILTGKVPENDAGVPE